MPLARGAVKTGMQRHARRLTGWRRTSGDGDTEERDTHEGKRFDRTPPSQAGGYGKRTGNNGLSTRYHCPLTRISLRTDVTPLTERAT